MVDINTTIRSGSVRAFPSYANYTALVADEFENSRQSIRQTLMSIGIGMVDQTASGKGVIEACYARKYDLVLCDFRLGQGKNGQQVLEELRQLKLLKSSAIFIVISAETNRDVVFGIMESQPDDYLSKPFTQGVLSKRLERLFTQSDTLQDMKKAQAAEDYPALVSLCKKHIDSSGRYVVWCKKALVEVFLATSSWLELTNLCDAELDTRDIEWAMLGIARMHVACEAWDVAIQYLENILKRFPQCVLGYDLLALSLEKKGRFAKAQQALEKGIKLSPLASARQQSMMKVSLENGDVQAAVKASQQTLKLVTNTINESPEQYFQLADLLSEASVDLEGSDRKRMADDALTALNRVSKKFSEDHEVKIKKALSESRLYAYQGHEKQRNACLDAAIKIIEEHPAFKTTDVSIQLGKTLYLADRKEEAEKQWQSLEQEHTITDAQQKSILDFLDEPIPIGARVKAKHFNAKGLSHYAKKEYTEAIFEFEEALKISKNNPGLNLNLVQTIIKMMENTGQSEVLKDKCSKAFHRLKHVGQGHKQFSRLQTLQAFMARYN